MGKELEKVGVFIGVETRSAPIIKVTFSLLVELEKAKSDFSETAPLINVQKAGQVFVDLKSHLAFNVNLLEGEVFCLDVELSISFFDEVGTLVEVTLAEERILTVGPVSLVQGSGCKYALLTGVLSCLVLLCAGLT